MLLCSVEPYITPVVKLWATLNSILTSSVVRSKFVLSGAHLFMPQGWTEVHQQYNPEIIGFDPLLRLFPFCTPVVNRSNEFQCIAYIYASRLSPLLDLPHSWLQRP